MLPFSSVFISKPLSMSLRSTSLPIADGSHFASGKISLIRLQRVNFDSYTIDEPVDMNFFPDTFTPQLRNSSRVNLYRTEDLCNKNGIFISDVLEKIFTCIIDGVENLKNLCYYY
jgi:hypothetical protein